MAGIERNGSVGGHENEGNGGQKAGEPSSAAGGGGRGVVTPPQGVSIRAPDRIAPPASENKSRRRREEPKLVPATGLASYQGRTLRILDPHAFQREQIEEQGRKDENATLRAQLEVVTGSLEALQGQTVDIDALKSTVQLQSTALEALQSQVMTLLTAMDDLKKGLIIQSATEASGQQQDSIESFLGSAAGAVTIPSLNSLQEEGMVSAADTQSSGSSVTQGADMVETETRTGTVPLLPPDHQQEENMFESIEFLSDLPPITISSAEAGIPPNPEERYVNGTEETSADSSDHANLATSSSVLLTDHEHTENGTNVNSGQDEPLGNGGADDGASGKASPTNNDEMKISSTTVDDKRAEVHVRTIMMQSKGSMKRQACGNGDGVKNKKRFKCKLCSLSCNYKSALDIHISGFHHGEQHFRIGMRRSSQSSGEGKKSVRRPDSWSSSHRNDLLQLQLMSTHPENRLYSCEVCEEMFLNSDALERHQKSHLKERLQRLPEPQ